MSAEKLRPFRVKGKFLMGGTWRPFSKEFAACSEGECTELAYSVIGSNHKIKRRYINIKLIENIEKLDEIQDPLVRDKVGFGGKLGESE
jgi:large subunit ribosomal protein LX